MDQTQWVCYELPDGSYYYGEVAYLDDQGKPFLKLRQHPLQRHLVNGHKPKGSAR